MKNITLTFLLFASAGLFASTGTETIRHHIQPKETLFRISIIYNSTVQDILDANPGVTAQKIHEGMTINVPKDTKMRGAALVESLLNNKHDEKTTASTEVKKVIPQQVKKEVEHIQVSAPAHINGKADKPVEEKPAIKENIESAPAPVQAAKAVTPLDDKQAINQVVNTPSAVAKEVKAVPENSEVGEKLPTVSKAAQAIPVEYPVGRGASTSANDHAVQANSEDENPFLTPSEPRSRAVADEQIVKKEEISNPASADKAPEMEDENPFITPRHKADVNKAIEKTSAGTSSTE